MSAVLPLAAAAWGAVGSAGFAGEGAIGGALSLLPPLAGEGWDGGTDAEAPPPVALRAPTSPAGGGGAAAGASPSASRTATTLPSDSLSPTLTLSSLTTPAAVDGTSIVALSDSSVTRPWSLATL